MILPDEGPGASQNNCCKSCSLQGKSIPGKNGKLEFQEPLFDIDAKLTNGQAEFSAASDASYQFDMSVSAGQTDNFKSSNDPAAHKVRIHVDNGKIQNEDQEVEDGN